VSRRPRESGVPSRAGDAPVRADHYSYALYADPHTAASFDAWRFGGPIGTIVSAEQERVLAGFLGDVGGLSALDVGTGTGRGALALARRGARVTGIDASVEMLKVAEARAREAGVPVTFEHGDAHAIGYPDRSFDVAVCLRVLMHAPDWRTCLAELCRVTRSRIVFDYPALCSAAALQAVGRRVALWLGRPTEAYRVLAARAVERELERSGFRLVARHRQFVLPIACHKLLGSPRFTRAVETALARAGLLNLVGSPVTAVAERCVY
jgi:2-polyprenyl-3-methyl-5-hydroxy-6-metoxy-1,4-benzoquinol methylase